MDVGFSYCDLVYWVESIGLGLHELELLVDSWVTQIRPSQMLYIRHIVISTIFFFIKKNTKYFYHTHGGEGRGKKVFKKLKIVYIQKAY